MQLSSSPDMLSASLNSIVSSSASDDLASEPSRPSQIEAARSGTGKADKNEKDNIKVYTQLSFWIGFIILTLV